MLGKEVKTLVSSFTPAGTYNISFDGSNLSSGVYFYKLEASVKDGSNFVMTKRMVLIK
jgi:hypothetical protein